MFWTTSGSAGLGYQFLPPIPFAGDPRVNPDWTLSPVSDEDPLRIERCSHHTILTSEPERALRLFVDALGGTKIHEGRDQAIAAAGTYVHLADAVYEFAVPDEGTPAHAAWSVNAPADTYYALTFKVEDLGRVERHLASQGVRIRSRSDDAIVTDPDTSIGIPWGFVTALTPGDPRGA
jgi:catechol 2,3-dioxygenase-like lactoylglutathione lyase family enzyme